MEFNKKNGFYFEYYITGEKESESEYKNGKKHGESISYYKSGQIKEKTNYKKGIEHGMRHGFYLNGQKKYKNNISDGFYKGLNTWYYVHGGKEREEFYKPFDEDPYLVIKYYSGGETFKKYDNNKNIDTTYYISGQIMKEEYINKKISYYKNDQTKHKKCSALQKKYYKNGYINSSHGVKSVRQTYTRVFLPYKNKKIFFY